MIRNMLRSLVPSLSFEQRLVIYSQVAFEFRFQFCQVCVTQGPIGFELLEDLLATLLTNMHPPYIYITSLLG